MGYAILVFLFVMLGSVGLFMAFGKPQGAGDVQRVKDRLLGKSSKAEKQSSGSAETPSLMKSEEHVTHIAHRILSNLRLVDRLETLIETAGVRWTPARLMQTAMLSAFGGFIVMWYMAPPPFDSFAWLGAIVGFAIPLLWLKRKGRARMKKFEEQFPDSLEFVARSMRAGHAFSVSLEMIHREFTDPLASEFRRTFDEQNLGLPLENALQNFAKRVPLLEVHFFVSAVLLQKRTGGNLAELLDKLASLIRERFKLRGKIKAISAHGRITASTLSIIPFAVAFLMFYTNRDYVEFFIKDPAGNALAGVALFFQVVGYLIMKKITTIEI